MGNCSNREREKKNSFNKEEKIILKSKFKSLCNSKNHLDKDKFIELFKENLNFGLKIFEFFELYSNNEISYHNFLNLVEILVKDSFDGLDEYSHFDKMEILALINIKERLSTKEQLRNHELTYIEGIEYVKDFIQMFFFNKINYQLNETAVRSIINSIFEQDVAKKKWGDFLLFFKEQLVFLSTLIKNYLSYKLLQNRPLFILPNLESPSYLLNNEMMSLLFLSNSFLQTSKKLKLIYSKSFDYLNFDELYNSLINFEGSTLLLFKHEENVVFGYDKTTDKKNFVFGAFNYLPWSKVGNEETNLFSLTPNFKMFTPKKNNEKNNYTYLNNSNDLKGLGIGKRKDNKFRLWIDQDIKYKNYCLDNDELFEKGNLIAPYIQNIKLSYVEIWGLDNFNDLTYHHVLGNTNATFKLKDRNDLNNSPNKAYISSNYIYQQNENIYSFEPNLSNYTNEKSNKQYIIEK